ncbi:MAG: hypothetical protein IPG50_15380 [Myxococcales bacterium]|nr:hypothetical protein [Myxococcales bacterium]
MLQARPRRVALVHSNLAGVLLAGAILSAACSACSEGELSAPGADGGSTQDGEASTTDAGAASDASVTGDAALANDAAVADAGSGFIVADVDGTKVNATVNVGARPGPVGTLQLGAGTDALTTSASYKGFILGVKNAVGTHSCATLGAASMNFGFNEAGKPVGWVADNYKGTCSVEVTRAAANVGDAIEGTFSGTLVDLAKAEHSVTGGSFKVSRVQ